MISSIFIAINYYFFKKNTVFIIKGFINYKKRIKIKTLSKTQNLILKISNDLSIKVIKNPIKAKQQIISNT